MRAVPQPPAARSSFGRAWLWTRPRVLYVGAFLHAEGPRRNPIAAAQVSAPACTVRILKCRVSFYRCGAGRSIRGGATCNQPWPKRNWKSRASSRGLFHYSRNHSYSDRHRRADEKYTPDGFLFRLAFFSQKRNESSPYFLHSSDHPPWHPALLRRPRPFRKFCFRLVRPRHSVSIGVCLALEHRARVTRQNVFRAAPGSVSFFRRRRANLLYRSKLRRPPRNRPVVSSHKNRHPLDYFLPAHMPESREDRCG